MDFQLPAAWLTGGGLGTMVAALYWGLYSGKLATGKEVEYREGIIAEQKETIKELLSQNSDLIRNGTVASNSLDKISQAAHGPVSEEGL